MPTVWRRSFFLLLGLGPLTFAACKKAGQAEVHLTGGDVVRDERYYAPTVYFTILNQQGKQPKNECTGAKLTARQFLTAAHCVFDFETKRHRLNPGYRIWLHSANDLDDSELGRNAWEFVVRAVHAHPDYKAGDESVDLAIVSLTDIIPQVPRAELPTAEPAPGTEVVKVGYGCEEGFEGPRTLGRLKFAFALTLSEDEVRTEYQRNGGMSEADAAGIAHAAEHGVFTRAVRGGGRAGLCYGDSGGPLYHKASGGLLVLGVNAMSYGVQGDHGIVDFHASVARHLDWLKPLLEP